MPLKELKARKAYNKAYHQKYYQKNGQRIKKRIKDFFMSRGGWTAHTPTKRKHLLKRRYGLTVAAYEAMLTGQNYRCAICHGNEWGKGRWSDKTKEPSVDHDHATGKVRGLLCSPCNTAIGLLKDNADICARAALYLRRDSI